MMRLKVLGLRIPRPHINGGVALLLAEGLGFAAIVFGVYLMWPPAAAIVGGGILVILAQGGSRAPHS